MLKAKSLQKVNAPESAEAYIAESMHEKLMGALDELTKRYGKPYRVFRNAVCGNGYEQIVFHLMFEFDGKLYGVFRRNLKDGGEWEKVKKIGMRYKISPRRILLVNTRISSEYADFLENYADYYITNLTEECFRRKIIAMVENDFTQEVA